MTIGTLALFRGLAFVVIGDDSVTDFPATWTDRAFGNFAGTFIPNTMVLFADPRRRLRRCCCTRRRSGARSTRSARTRRPPASPASPSRRIKLILFVLSGAVAALAGVVISLRNSTAAANVGQGFELTAITAVLLGGVSIFGGRGHDRRA